MNTILINLKNNSSLRFEHRDAASPDHDRVWRLYNDQTYIRTLNEFEAEFVEAAMAAAREGNDMQRRGDVVYSGTFMPRQFDEDASLNPVDNTSAGKDNQRVYVGGTHLDMRGFVKEEGQVGHAFVPTSPVFVTGFLPQDTPLPLQSTHLTSFQSRVKPWTIAVFGTEKAYDKDTRSFRFAEEATELVQACGLTKEEMLTTVEYVYSRPVGHIPQEVGGTMTTLASLCNAYIDLDMHVEGEKELARCQQPEVIAKIRAKQAQKPKRVDPDVEST